MIIPDINLLVYAYNAADPRHEAAKGWWEDLMNGRQPVGLPWLVVAGFIRLMTNPRVLMTPMRVGEATQCARTWVNRRQVVVVHPGARFGYLFLDFLDKAGAAGNLTTDAYLAALAVEHQAEVHSNDSDFSRFGGLRWKNPLSG